MKDVKTKGTQKAVITAKRKTSQKRDVFLLFDFCLEQTDHKVILSEAEGSLLRCFDYPFDRAQGPLNMTLQKICLSIPKIFFYPHIKERKTDRFFYVMVFNVIKKILLFFIYLLYNKVNIIFGVIL